MAWDNRLCREAREWIEEISCTSFAEDENTPEAFAASLKDGVILCELVNKIKPGSVPKINKPATMPFKKMENIANYLKAVRALGMKEFEMFGTPDLYDEKNVIQVVQSTHALGRLLQAIMPTAPFPKLGIKVVEKNERHFSEAQLKEARSAVSVMNLGSSDMGKKAFQDVLAGEGFKVKGSGPKAAAKEPSPEPEMMLGSMGLSRARKEKEAAAAAGAAAPAAVPKPAAAAPAPAAPAVAPLPAGWEELEADDGRKYYYAEATEETTWERPTAPAKAAAPAAPASSSSALPPGWEELDSDDGRKYYYHEATDRTQWDRPASLPAGWEELTTDDGKVYYYNEAQDKTQWSVPTA